MYLGKAADTYGKIFFEGEIKEGNKIGKSNQELESSWKDLIISKLIIFVLFPGIKYYSNGFKFEGELKEYDEVGKGILFDENGKISFQGEFKGGSCWNGKGKRLIINNYSEMRLFLRYGTWMVWELFPRRVLIRPENRKR